MEYAKTSIHFEAPLLRGGLGLWIWTQLRLWVVPRTIRVLRGAAAATFEAPSRTFGPLLPQPPMAMPTAAGAADLTSTAAHVVTPPPSTITAANITETAAAAAANAAASAPSAAMLGAPSPLEAPAFWTRTRTRPILTQMRLLHTIIGPGSSASAPVVPPSPSDAATTFVRFPAALTALAAVNIDTPPPPADRTGREGSAVLLQALVSTGGSDGRVRLLRVAVDDASGGGEVRTSVLEVELPEAIHMESVWERAAISALVRSAATRGLLWAALRGLAART